MAAPTPEPLPPREVPLREVARDALPPAPISRYGIRALDIEPKKWRHAETPHFILHYRRVTEAQKVAREVEYDLWFTAKMLGASPDRYQRKSRVYVFEDEEEWQDFLSETGVPAWSVSFAHGDELFLNVRGTSRKSRFASDTLAHEATHAVVARLYPDRRWPLWLNEGFAEYMGSASVAARKSQTLKRHQVELPYADLSIDELLQLNQYPNSEENVGRLYQTSEKLVRYLMTELPRDRFPKLVEALLNNVPFEKAILDVYGDKVPNYPAFVKGFNKFKS
jgi:hypothetical protein